MTHDALGIAQRITAACAKERRTLHEIHERYPEHVPSDIARIASGLSHSSAVYGQWEEVGRQVLAIHPELLRTVRTSGSSKIVPEVFAAIPYISPMVVFPDTPKLQGHTDGESFRALGFIACGRTETEHGTVVTNTHAPRLTHFAAQIVVEVTLADGTTDLEMDYISFPANGEPFTINEAVDGVLSRFDWSYRGSSSSAEAFMRSLVRMTLGSVLYLASKTLDDDGDSEKVPASVVRRATGMRKPPFSVYRVGWQIGAALSDARPQRFDANDKPLQGTAALEQDPQHRRAHFKTVWTGPGSRVPKTVFVAPYWTHIERLGPRGVNTVRRVSKD